MSDELKKKKILRIWWVINIFTWFSLICSFVLIVLFQFNSVILFKQKINSEMIVFSILAIILWILFCVCYWFATVYCFFNLAIRWNKSLRSIQQRFPVNKSGIILFIYKYVYLLPIQEKDEVKFNKPNEKMKKIIKAFIVSFYIITILLSSGFLGLAIYILGTSDDILILGVFQLFTAIFIIVYVHIMIIPVIIYQTIKWNSLEEEDFKNKILWVLFNRYAKEYPYWWMKKNINIHIKNKKGYDEEIFWK